PGTSDQAARTKIAEWKALVEEDRTALKPRLVEPVKGKADSGESQKSAVKFHYRVRSNRVNDFDWFWVLDMDPGCLETQTKPATSEQLTEAKTIMKRHIFDLATGQRLGLTVDATAMGGGGHISLDMASLFGGSPELLLGVLKALQDDVAAWDEHFHYVDEPNSPWLKDQGFEANTTKGKALDRFRELVTDLEREIALGAVTFDEITVRLRDFHTRVLNLWANARKDSNNETEKKQARDVLVTKDRPHYQAVNVEHLVKPRLTADEDRRRIELRAIGAQPSTDRLAQDLAFVYERIERAQAAVLDKVEERRARRTS
ncbi:MAG: hypothetical protein QOJ35_2825, partial [Solirubrobacteraceae bacterium]|nr:hypothetical protein [Solirubrobacteraceae bacterium]